MCGTAASGCRQLATRQGERNAVDAGGGQIPCKQPTGWGKHVGIAAGRGMTHNGKSWRRERRGEGRKSIYGSSC